MIDVWYKDAIVYSLDVETSADSNSDGVGDFAGLTAKLDYLHGLDVNRIWPLAWIACSTIRPSC
jgi:maltose alpha-D-glucosyltransferase/alpha-amylase